MALLLNSLCGSNPNNRQEQQQDEEQQDEAVGNFPRQNRHKKARRQLMLIENVLSALGSFKRSKSSVVDHSGEEGAGMQQAGTSGPSSHASRTFKWKKSRKERLVVTEEDPHAASTSHKHGGPFDPHAGPLTEVYKARFMEVEDDIAQQQ